MIDRGAGSVNVGKSAIGHERNVALLQALAANAPNLAVADGHFAGRYTEAKSGSLQYGLRRSYARVLNNPLLFPTFSATIEAFVEAIVV